MTGRPCPDPVGRHLAGKASLPRTGRAILHVDMDAFFAAVEVLDDPSLAGRPLIVGGTGPRGVVASCSYEARAYGVRSAMPSARARRLCPQALFLAARFDRYLQISRRLQELLESFTPLVETIALDEAFLDVTGSLRLLGLSPGKLAWEVRARVADELGLACSVGCATAKFLAKLASEAAKPSVGPGGVIPGKGVVVIEPGRELEFLHPQPIEALWGVGPATLTRLRRLGVVTVGDLACLPVDTVRNALGRAVGAHLCALARGVDDRQVEPRRELKSISQEETYPVDRHDTDGLAAEVLRMADAVTTRLRRAGLAARTVTLKLRYGDFRTLTRSRTLPEPVQSAFAVGRAAGALLASVDLTPGVRLLGVGVSNLVPPGGAPLQLALFPPTAGRSDTAARPEGDRFELERHRVASEVVDAVRSRFGPAALAPASLLGPGGPRVKRPGDSQRGPG